MFLNSRLYTFLVLSDSEKNLGKTQVHTSYDGKVTNRRKNKVCISKYVLMNPIQSLNCIILTNLPSPTTHLTQGSTLQRREAQALHQPTLFSQVFHIFLTFIPQQANTFAAHALRPLYTCRTSAVHLHHICSSSPSLFHINSTLIACLSNIPSTVPCLLHTPVIIATLFHPLHTISTLSPSIKRETVPLPLGKKKLHLYSVFTIINSVAGSMERVRSCTASRTR